MGFINVGNPEIAVLGNLYIHEITSGDLSSGPFFNNLPPGLAYSMGNITGTPTTNGVYECVAYGFASLDDSLVSENFVIIVTDADYNTNSDILDPFKNINTDVVNDDTGNPPSLTYKFFDNARFENISSGYVDFDFVIKSTDIFPTQINFSGEYTGNIDGNLTYVALTINQVPICEIDISGTQNIAHSPYSISVPISKTTRDLITNNRRLHDGSNDIATISVETIEGDPSYEIVQHNFSISFTGYKPEYLTVPIPNVTRLFPLSIVDFIPSSDDITNSSGNQINLIDYINSDDNNTSISGLDTWSAILRFQVPSGYIEEDKIIDKIKFNLTYRHDYGTNNRIDWMNPSFYYDENEVIGWSKGFGIDYEPDWIEKSEHFIRMKYDGFNNTFLSTEICDVSGYFNVEMKNIPLLARISSVSVDLYESDYQNINMYTDGQQFLPVGDYINFLLSNITDSSDTIDFFTIRYPQVATALAMHTYSDPTIYSELDIFTLGTPTTIDSIDMFTFQSPVSDNVDMFVSAFDVHSEEISIFLNGQPSYEITDDINLFITSSDENSLFSINQFYINSDIDRNNIITMFISTNVVEDDNIIDMYLNSDNSYNQQIAMFVENNREEAYYQFHATIFASYETSESINIFVGGE